MGNCVEGLKKVKVGYITPIEYLECVPKTSTFHLILAHLLGDHRYVDFYNDRYDAGDYIILDNSAFEFKRPIEADELIEFIKGSGIKVDCVVAPDYPFCKGDKTVDSAKNFIKQIREYGYDYDVMAVPQSEEGDVADWLSCYQKLQNIDGITHIGMSILGIPNAFCSVTGTKDIMVNRLFAAEYIVKNNLNTGSMWHHFLGLGQPRELLLQRQIGLIDSNDSSSACWHGINGITYDDSLGGLVNGKIDAPVNFELHCTKTDKERQMKYIMLNINFIKKMCGE